MADIPFINARAVHSTRDSVRISNEVYALLIQIEAEAVLGDLLNSITLDEAKREALTKELRQLWEQRCIRLHPSQAARVVKAPIVCWTKHNGPTKMALSLHAVFRTGAVRCPESDRSLMVGRRRGRSGAVLAPFCSNAC